MKPYSQLIFLIVASIGLISCSPSEPTERTIATFPTSAHCIPAL